MKINLWLAPFLLLMWSLPFRASGLEQKRVDIAVFGAKPDDGKDDSKALAKAAQYCRDNPGTVLVFSPGAYILKNAQGIETERAAMRGEMGDNPERVIFTPYYPYGIGMDFSGSQCITIEGNGAKINCYGWMEPISIEDCIDFTLEGLTIDYPEKPFSSGKVVKVSPHDFEIQFSKDRIIDDKMILGRMTFWDLQKDKLTPDVLYFPKRELLGDNRVRFHAKICPETVGQIANVLHCFHFRPAILIHRSVNTVIRNVTIHAQAGMGVVGFDSRNILLEKLEVRPAPGYYQSTNTDATHFASCDGLLRFDNCYFEAQGDDATNVHGYYHTVLTAKDNQITTKLEAPTFTHIQVIDLPRVGDRLELVNRETLEVVDTFTVQHAAEDKQTLINTLTLDRRLEIDPANYFVMNISKLPRLEFVNSVINSHLARGILVKTRDVLIENNRFNGCSNTAIHVGAESWWNEGTHSENVVIRDNVISGCGFAGTQGGASGIAFIIDAKNTRKTFLHKNIRIENNVIVGSGNLCGIYIGNTSGALLTGNTVSNCEMDVYIKSSNDIKIKKK